MATYYTGQKPNQIDPRYPRRLPPLTCEIPGASGLANATAQGAQTFTSDTSAPSGAPSTVQGAFAVADDGKEVHPWWQLKGRFEAADSASSYATVVLWTYDDTDEEWYPTREMRMVCNAALSEDYGNIFTLDGVGGSTHAYFQVTGLTGTDDLRLSLRPLTGWKYAGA
jgi:hypothetical protein